MILPVVAALFEGDRGILLGQRAAGSRHAGRWEFPGGKVEAGESPESALARELREELGIEAEIGAEVWRTRHRYPGIDVEVRFFAVDAWRGEIENRVFGDLAWVPRGGLAAVDILEADRDLALRLDRGEVRGRALDPSVLEGMRRDGFALVDGFLSPSDVDEVREALAPEFRKQLFGRNDFEGHRTERVYSLAGRGFAFERLVEHPMAMEMCAEFLEPNFLLTASQAIRIQPGESPQPLHTDDLFYSIPRPRPPVSVSVIVAIDEFRADNGCTEIVAGSHEWSDAEVDALLRGIDFETKKGGAPSDDPTESLPASIRERLTPVEMAAGSAIFFFGTLAHRGGGNRSDAPRLALTSQYCQPWARPQENYIESIPKPRAAGMTPRLQGLLGYSIHPPFMGHVNGLHPQRLLRGETIGIEGTQPLAGASKKSTTPVSSE